MVSFLLFNIIYIHTCIAELQLSSTVNALTPSQNGISITYNPDTTNTFGSSYNVSVKSQNAYDLAISLESQWGFKSNIPTTLILTINGNTPDPTADADFIIVFTIDNTQFFSFFVHLDTTNIRSKIYPYNKLAIQNDILSYLQNTTLYPQRWDRVSHGNNWAVTKPRYNSQAQWPLQFHLTNNISSNTCIFSYYDQATTYQTGNTFNQTFITNKPMNIYIMGDTSKERYQIFDINMQLHHANPTAPTISPTFNPITPTTSPILSTTTTNPAISPTSTPSIFPSTSPSKTPSVPPSISPSHNPTGNPSQNPSQTPTKYPSQTPSQNPTGNPSQIPTLSPTQIPSQTPSQNPSKIPSQNPSKFPSQNPSQIPTQYPTEIPSDTPSVSPSNIPSIFPSDFPTETPIEGTKSPTTPNPSSTPTYNPTFQPSMTPTLSPTLQPTITPTLSPTLQPTFIPTETPSDVSLAPVTATPSISPTNKPTNTPTVSPSVYPSISPSYTPSISPTITTINPSGSPTLEPTIYPTYYPTQEPIITIIITKPDIASTIQTTDIILTDNFVQEPADEFDEYSYIVIIVIFVSVACYAVIILLIVAKRNQKRHENTVRKDKTLEIIATSEQKAPHDQFHQKFHSYEKVDTASPAFGSHGFAYKITELNPDEFGSIENDNIIMEEEAEEYRAKRINLLFTGHNGNSNTTETTNTTAYNMNINNMTMESKEGTDSDEETTVSNQNRILQNVIGMQQDGIYEETETKLTHAYVTDYEEEDTKYTTTEDGFVDRTTPNPWKTMEVSFSKSTIISKSANSPRKLKKFEVNEYQKIPIKRHNDNHRYNPKISIKRSYNSESKTQTYSSNMQKTQSNKPKVAFRRSNHRKRLPTESYASESQGKGMNLDINTCSSSEDEYQNRLQMDAFDYVENLQVLKEHDMAINMTNKNTNISNVLEYMDSAKKNAEIDLQNKLSLKVMTGDSVEYDGEY